MSTSVAPIGTSQYTDGLGVLVLSLGATYTWRIRAYTPAWTSLPTEITAQAPLICI
jgi:hypothetical protein